MSHTFFDGSIYHKRYSPKVHDFRYPFYFLDIDIAQLSALKNRLFSLEGFNLFGFKSKDHFGKSDDFVKNIEELLKKFNLTPTPKMHFLTLPRVMNFVFNPISVLVLFEEDTPTHLLAEVHNYNGGRVVYSVPLSSEDGKLFRGVTSKDMYVSPFLQTLGEYRFVFSNQKSKLLLKVDLYEEDRKKLTASFSGTPKPFNNATIAKLFLRHSFLTLWVVTRTLWQSFRLWRKGLRFYSPTPADTLRRY